MKYKINSIQSNPEVIKVTLKWSSGIEVKNKFLLLFLLFLGFSKYKESIEGYYKLPSSLDWNYMSDGSEVPTGLSLELNDIFKRAVHFSKGYITTHPLESDWKEF